MSLRAPTPVLATGSIALAAVALVLGACAVPAVPCVPGEAGCRCREGDSAEGCDPGLDCLVGLCFGDGISPPESYLFSERAQGDEALVDALLNDQIALAPGMVVADIGAGDGFFTLHAAREVRPGGRVYATDIDPATLDAVKAGMERAMDGAALAATVEQRLVQGPRDTALDDLAEGSLDLIMMARVFTFQIEDHDEDLEYLRRLTRLLRPGGRLVYYMDYVTKRSYRDYLSLLMREAGLTGPVTEIPLPEHIPESVETWDFGAESVRAPMVTMYRGFILVFRTQP